jgi:hypothetical protein
VDVDVAAALVGSALRPPEAEAIRDGARTG